ncbi:MAG: cyclase family protein [bacterium]|jgi:arylformamidase
MAIYDITLPLRAEHPPWPGDAPFSCEQVSSIAKGDSCNVSQISMSSHFATHLDAPRHFIDEGMTVDQLDLQTVIGPALVVEVDTPDLIRPEHLPDLKNVERILFKTANSRFVADTDFHTDYVALGLEAAQALSRAGVILIGIDYFSIEAFKNPGHPVHRELCGNGIILVEGLDLRNIDPGMYELICLPLTIAGCDGSPCRAILRDL